MKIIEFMMIIITYISSSIRFRFVISKSDNKLSIVIIFRMDIVFINLTSRFKNIYRNIFKFICTITTFNFMYDSIVCFAFIHKIFNFRNIVYIIYSKSFPLNRRKITIITEFYINRSLF